MAHGKLYRSFIILQEDERGHSISADKPLSGYAKIEVKNDTCKIAFYAQNLKKDYGKCHMVLICSKKEIKHNINLGVVNINQDGKAEITVEHMANNIGSTGVGYDKVVGAALCKEGNGKLNFLMCGFLNGEQPNDDWKNYKLVYGKQIEEKSDMGSKKEDKKFNKEEVKELKKEHYEEHHEHHEHHEHEKHHEHEEYEEKCDKEATYKDKYDEVVKEYKEPCDFKDMELESRFDNYEREIDNHRSEDVNLESRFDDYEGEIDNFRGKDISQKGRVDNYGRRIDNFRADQEDACKEMELKGSMGEFFKSVTDGLENMKDFGGEIKNSKWYKVPVNNIDEMLNITNYNKYTVMYYPMINYYPYIKNKGYFLMGFKCDGEGRVNYIIYAVPGTKDKGAQPYGGKTGFVTWMEDPDDKNSGYWLMFYDFKNSMIVIPMK